MAFAIGIPFYWCEGPQSSPGGYVRRQSWLDTGHPYTRVVIKPLGGEGDKLAQVADDPIEVDESVFRKFSTTAEYGCPA